MALTLTVLGCSGTYARAGDACSGYLVSASSTRLWLDAGPGTLANVQRHVSLRDLDAVVLSHCHPDHWLEVPVLRNALKYGVGHEGVPVYGTAETRAKVEAVVDGDLEPTLVWHTITDGDVLLVGDLRLSCSRTDHPVETLATRIDDISGGGGDGAASMIYTADTGSGWSPAKLGVGTDLLLCEATLPAEREDETLHLTGRQAGRFAAEAEARRLVITHVMPGDDAVARAREARAAFAGIVEVATVNAVYQL